MKCLKEQAWAIILDNLTQGPVSKPLTDAHFPLTLPTIWSSFETTLIKKSSVVEPAAAWVCQRVHSKCLWLFFSKTNMDSIRDRGLDSVSHNPQRTWFFDATNTHAYEHLAWSYYSLSDPKGHKGEFKESREIGYIEWIEMRCCLAWIRLFHNAFHESVLTREGGFEEGSSAKSRNIVAGVLRGRHELSYWLENERNTQEQVIRYGRLWLYENVQQLTCVT